LSKIELKNLLFSRDNLEILNIPSLTLESGSQTVLTGSSGCGKSTLIHLLAGFLRPDSGQYLLDGISLENLSERRWDALRAERLGVVFQHYPMLRGFHLLDNLLIPMGLKGRVDKNLAISLLTRVGLADRLYHRPSQLSAGQRQRASIVRAVVNKPDFVLADEPTAHLDPESGATAISLLKELTQEAGATLLMVSHDPLFKDEFSQHIEFESLAVC
jgi:putative ABC transport system ATP-binding protein